MKVGFAPLQLEGYYVEHIRCSVVAEPDRLAQVDMLPGLHMHSPLPPAISLYGVNVGFGAAQNEKNKQRYRLELRVTNGEEEKNNPLPYHFDVTLVGFFRLMGMKTTPHIEPAMIRNAAMILYSSARELLASVTGRGPFPAIVLPTVFFDPSGEATPAKKPRKAIKAPKRINKKK
jgi:preprotein translocase subunit SecB